MSHPEPDDFIVRAHVSLARMYRLGTLLDPEQYLLESRDDAVWYAFVHAKRQRVRAWFDKGQAGLVLLGTFRDETARLLLVEPRDDSRDLYVDYLRAQGFSVETADNADDGFVRSRHVDAVVTGIRLTGSTDGLELVRRLRRDEGTRRIPVVVLTACAFEMNLRLAFDAGCDLFLPKPCLPDRLVDEIRRLLARRHLAGSPGLSATVPAHANHPVLRGLS